MTLLILILGACSTCLLGGVGIGLYLAGMIDLTHQDEDRLARWDREAMR